MARSFAFLALLLVSACAASPTPPPAAPTVAATTPALDVLPLLPPAPAPGALADKQDVSAMLVLQAKRTQAMCDFAQADVDSSLKRFVAPLGLTLNGDTVQSEALMKTLIMRLRTASDIAKNHYKRPRPYNHGAGLVACISKAPASSYSYPSDHAALGYMMAHMLSQIIPEQQAKWQARAAEYGRSAIVGGVHYPSDVEAGRIMGLALAEHALQDPAVQAQLQLARPELRRTLGY
jgi:acid phosphatase (class A)